MKTCSCRCSTPCRAEIGKVNVTMGYPLRASLAYTFVERLVELQSSPPHEGRQAARSTMPTPWAFSRTPTSRTAMPARPAPMQDEIVRERRISVDAAWLGRNDLLRMDLFARRRRGASCPTGCCGVVAAVARTALRGRRRGVSAWSFWP